MYEWITVNDLPWSYERAAWQDPPPCVAPPMTVKLTEAPCAQVTTEAPSPVVSLISV
jgi:hypothetical protein